MSSSVAVSPASVAAVRPPLARPRACLVAGVSGGLADHLGAPVWAVRALFVVLGGAGLLLYTWCWAFMPWRPGADAVSRRAPVAWMLVALAAAGLLATQLAGRDPLGSPWMLAPDASTPLPARLVVTVGFTAVVAGAAGVWAGVIDRADPARGVRHSVAVRLAAVVILALLGGITIGGLQGLPVGPMAVLLIALPFVGMAAVLSSSLLRGWRELSGERIRRIREEQRSEMAAHLHDSVLQTLALIQNRAGASSEAARLARAQERELRAWLYDGDAPADSDLPTDLRDWAGALELDYPVRIDVVSAGLSAERASGEVAAAAREAMLNAARHAGGDVSVYIEGSGSGVDVYIRDRGPGFDLDAVPGDRLGVRESVIGRMRRTGGTASVRSGAAGTEVHLHYGAGTGDGRG